MTDYELKRSGRRTVSIQVTREGAVVVRAPWRMPARDIERLVAGRRAWIEDTVGKQQARAAAHPEPDGEALRAMKERAARDIPPRVAHYAAVMGLRPSAVKITAAATRFGSCSAKNSLCFSCRLTGYPPEAVDYVVVHELAHIVHKNHGRDFYALVASVLPDYKERRSLLKR